MYFGLECSILVFIQYDLYASLLVTTSLFMVAYEIYVGLNLSFKKYSLHKAKSFSFGNIIPLLFGGTGIWFGKVLADMDHTDFKLWIVIVGCSMLITGAFSFIQKAVIFKILNKERE